MASRDPDDLHPDLRPIYDDFMNLAEADGLDILTTCTWRSSDEQDDLYAQGRTKSGPIVTRARGGQSAHNFMLEGKPAAKAFDIVPLVGGKPSWGTIGDAMALWQRAGAIGKCLGLNWYGAPDAPFREFPHFQLKE